MTRASRNYQEHKKYTPRKQKTHRKTLDGMMLFGVTFALFMMYSTSSTSFITPLLREESFCNMKENAGTTVGVINCISKPGVLFYKSTPTQVHILHPVNMTCGGNEWECNSKQIPIIKNIMFLSRYVGITNLIFSAFIGVFLLKKYDFS